MKERLRPVLLAVVYLLFFILGTPGLDFLEGKDLSQPPQRARLEKQIGTFWAGIGLSIYDFSQVTRVPLVQLLNPIQRPFRISQSWSLYRDGPSDCQRMEIQIDGTIVYRSVDADYRWQEEVFRNRRIRPMVEATTNDTNSPNWRALYRWVQQQALIDFPSMQELKMVAIRGNFPCDTMLPHHQIVGKAPNWRPSLTLVTPAEVPANAP